MCIFPGADKAKTAKEAGVTGLIGAGDAIDTSTPFGIGELEPIQDTTNNLGIGGIVTAKKATNSTSAGGAIVGAA